MQMRENPLVSVIVPVYNVEKYLPQCLDSLLAQTLEQIEIICVDDCSPDNSKSVLEAYARRDPRIRVIRLPENQRQGGARNAGIRAARAEHVGFVDSDDFVSPLMYECLWKAALASQADIVINDYFCYYSENDIREVRLPVLPSGERSPERDNLLFFGGFRLWTSLFKKSMFSRYDLFFPEKTLYEDNAVLVPLFLCAGQIVQLSAPHYHYRCSDISSTVRTFDDHSFFERLETAKMLFQNMKRLGFYKPYKEETEGLFIDLFFTHSMTGCFFRFSRPPATHMRKIMAEMHEILPDYRKNGYYRKNPLKRRMLLRLCELNLPAALFACKAMKAMSKRGNAMKTFKR